MQIEIGNLNTDVGTFHASQKAHPSAAEIFHVMITGVKVFQKTDGSLIKFDAADQLHVGVFGVVGIGSDIFDNGGTVKIIRIRFNAVKKRCVKIAGNLDAGTKQIFRQNTGQCAVMGTNVLHKRGPFALPRMMIQNNLRLYKT